MVKIIAKRNSEVSLEKLTVGDTFIYTDEINEKTLGMACYDEYRERIVYFNLATGQLIKTKDGYCLKEEKVLPVDITITY